MVCELSSAGGTLGIVLGVKKKLTAQKISTVALDGTPYVQQTGTAIDRRDVDVYCATLGLKDAVDSASNTGAAITLYPWMNQRIMGYIEKDVSWKEWADGHGVGHFTMIVKEVVDA